MKAKRTLSIIFILIILSATFSSPVYAQENVSPAEKTLADLEINYDTMLGHENRDYGTLVTELLENGVSSSDADFYAKMDILANQIEVQNIDLYEVETAQTLSPQYIQANIDIVRADALNLDPSALKALLSQNDAFFYGSQDTRTLRDELQTEGSSVSSMIVQYPDGSSIQISSDCISKEDISSEVATNGTPHISGPWNSASSAGLEYGESVPIGTSTLYTDCNFYSGSSFAKVRDAYTCKVELVSGERKVSFVRDDGATSYAGVAKIVSEDKSNHVNSVAQARGTYVQGYTDAFFEVSSTFSATYAGLSISATAGAGWHQYAITEVSYNGLQYSYAAKFQ